MNKILNILMIIFVIITIFGIYDNNAYLYIMSPICVMFLYVIKNLYNKITMHEKFLLDTKNSLGYAVLKMRKIDKSGAFESDDEVGQIFKRLLSEIEEIDKFFK